MTATDEEVRKMATVREWLVKELDRKRETVRMLETNLAFVDAQLKEISFKPASTMTEKPAEVPKPAEPAKPTPPAPASTPSISSIPRETKQLVRAKDNMVLAECIYTADMVTITPVPTIVLNTTVKPFGSFFVERILKGMHAKEASLTFNVEKDDNNVIQSVTIRNYKTKERLTEIFNTAAWVFTRMLEKP